MQQQCPSCGLVVTMRGPRITYCPRCLAMRRSVVEMIEAPAAVPPGAGGYDQRTMHEPAGPRSHPRAPAGAPSPRRTVRPPAPGAR
jgi:hypothetical protein